MLPSLRLFRRLSPVFTGQRALTTSGVLRGSSDTPKPPLDPARRRYELSTRVVALSSGSDQHEATSMPVYQTATFGLNSADGAYDYTRSGNPTRDTLQDVIADIEHGCASFAFTSGMAALTTAVRAVVGSGGRVVAGADLYGGMHRMLSHSSSQNGFDLEFIDITNLEEVEKALATPTTLLCIETPSNPLMEVVDVRGVTALAKKYGALTLADSSLMSPALMNPLDLGCDLVVHSATKFMSGHSDVMAGVVVAKDNEVAEKVAFVQNAEGAALAPFDCWLVLRGLKTMSLRVHEAQRNAITICDFLRQHPSVGQVHYLHPRDVNQDPACKLHFSQASGGGAVLSFVPKTGSVEFSKRLCEATELFKTTVSFGSVHSLIEMPCLASHASIPEEERHLPDSLVRVAVGVEDVNDLLADLSNALALAAEADESGIQRLRTHSLGVPLPPNASADACSASMPLWSDVIGYEEGDPTVHSALSVGYPRFVYSPSVANLMSKCTSLFGKQGDVAIVAPSARVALRLQKFATEMIGDASKVSVHDVGVRGVYAVTLPEEHAAVGKAFWQHTGCTVSSRSATLVCDELDELHELRSSSFWSTASNRGSSTSSTSTDAYSQLRRRIGSICEQEKSDVFLYPTGMAAVNAAHQVLQSCMPDGTQRKFVVFGFPYLDTLKLLQHPHLGPGAHFIGNNCYDTLERVLREGVSGVFIEFPSNPLLQCPDVERIVKLAHQYEAPVVVDDTIASFVNVNLMQEGGPDMAVSSLTKLFSGYGNAMGGAMMINRRSPVYDRLYQHTHATFEETLAEEDALRLLTNAVDLETRNARINQSAETLATYLQQHPAVEHVYFPKFTTPELYNSFRRESCSGYGGLMSVVLKNKAKASAVYDSLFISKGPGFGTSFSLVCPYTLLAHYHELAFAQAYGVHPSLLRMWVGLEPVDQIVSAWESALRHAEIGKVGDNTSVYPSSLQAQQPVQQ